MLAELDILSHLTCLIYLKKINNVPFSTLVGFQVRGGTNGGSGIDLRLRTVDVQIDGADYFLASQVQS